MGTIVFAGTDAVVGIVVHPAKPFPAIRVFPDPVPESLLDGGLLLLGEDCFALVQYALFIAVLIPDGIKYTCVAQVQAVLNDLVGVAPVSTVLRVHKVIVAVQTLVGDIPCAGGSRILRSDCMFAVIGRVQQVVDKIGNIACRNPCRTKAHINFVRFQILGLYGAKRIHVGLKPFAQKFYGSFRSLQLLAYIAGEVFVCGLPFFIGSRIAVRVLEDQTVQIRDQLILVHTGKLGHEIKINRCPLRHAHGQRF